MQVTTREKPIKILLGTSNLSPFSETAAGQILATFNAAVLGRLLETDASFNLKPGLLEKWEWDFKSKTYRLKLRSGIKFHNGREATASDLEFSLLRGFFSPKRSFYATYLGNIAGIEEAAKSSAFKSGVVSGIRITDSLSVEIRLSQPNPSFLHSLVNSYFSLVPKEELNPDYLTWKRVPIGAGPYKVLGNGFQDGKVALELVRSSFPRAPRLVEIYMSPKVSDFDYVALQASGIDLSKFKTHISEYPYIVVTAFFSNRNSMSENRLFREALSYSVNRNRLCEGLEAYRPTFEMLPRHFWGRTGLTDPYNPAKAKALLAQLPQESLKREWSVPAFSAGNTFAADYDLIYSRLSQQFSDVGLKIRFYPSTEKFISEDAAVKSPIFMTGRVSDYVDPLIMFASFRTNSAFEYERPKSDDLFEALYKDAASRQEQEDRVRTVQALSRHVSENFIALPLLEKRMISYYNPETLESLGEQDQPLTIFLERFVPKAKP